MYNQKLFVMQQSVLLHHFVSNTESVQELSAEITVGGQFICVISST